MQKSFKRVDWKAVMITSILIFCSMFAVNFLPNIDFNWYSILLPSILPTLIGMSLVIFPPKEKVNTSLEYYLVSTKYTFSYFETEKEREEAEDDILELVKASSPENAKKIVQEKAIKEEPEIIIIGTYVYETLIEKH